MPIVPLRSVHSSNLNQLELPRHVEESMTANYDTLQLCTLYRQGEIDSEKFLNMKIKMLMRHEVLYDMTKNIETPYR